MNILFILIVLQCVVFSGQCWESIRFQNTSGIPVSQVSSMYLSENQGIYYISNYNNSIRKVIKYQKGINSQVDVKLVQFIPNQQVYSKDTIYQINHNGLQYLIISSTQNSIVEIFNASTGVSVRKFTNSEPVNNYIYSKTRNQLLLLTIGGKVLVSDFTQILNNNLSTITQIYNYSQPIDGKISPDQNYLTVATYTTGQMAVIDLNTYVRICSADFSYADATKLAWNNDSTLVYFYNSDIGRIFTLNVITLDITVSNVIFNNAATLTICQFQYFSETQQIIMFVKNSSASGQLKILNYDPSLQKVTQTSIHTYSYTFKDALISKSLISNVLPFYILSSSPLLFQYGQIIFSMSTIIDYTVLPQIIPTLNNEQVPTVKSVRQMNVVNMYSQMMNGTLKSTLVTAMNKLPGSRKILKPLMSFFVNFDDIWLYNYHQRNYDYVLTSTFEAVQSLEKQKWHLFPFDSLQNLVGLQMQPIVNLQNLKLPFTTTKFLQIQGSSNGYISQTLDFYTTHLFFLFAIYIGGKLLYMFLKYFNLSFKSIFHLYGYWIYFPMICTQGNVQYLSYIFGFQMQTLVKNTFQINILNISTICINFSFLFFVISMFYIVRYIYAKDAHSLFDNCHHTNKGMFYLTFHFGIRNFLLGTVHSMSVITYQTKLYFLLLVEILFFIFNVIYVRFGADSCFFTKSKQWIIIWTAFLRIGMVLSFMLEKNISNFQDENFGNSNFSKFYAISLSLYMCLWFVFIATQMSLIFSHLKSIMCQSDKKIVLEQKVPLKNVNSSLKQSLQVGGGGYKRNRFVQPLFKTDQQLQKQRQQVIRLQITDESISKQLCFKPLKKKIRVSKFLKPIKNVQFLQKQIKGIIQEQSNIKQKQQNLQKINNLKQIKLNQSSRDSIKRDSSSGSSRNSIKRSQTLVVQSKSRQQQQLIQNQKENDEFQYLSCKISTVQDTQQGTINLSSKISSKISSKKSRFYEQCQDIIEQCIDEQSVVD